MTVKDIVTLAATQLGIADSVQDVIDGKAGADTKTLTLLVECFNIVENELALDYLPLYAEDEVYSDTGRVEFTELSQAAVRILRVEDEWGNALPFKLFPSYLVGQPGRVKITYTYTPKKKDITGSSEYTLLASERLFSYGIAAEYCVAMGLYEESAVWDKKYKEGIEAACSGGKSVRLASRRWV